jgi:GT2 family glycosyltransferase
MITIIYSTHKDEAYNVKFKQHILQSVGLNDVQILEYQNNNQYSLAEIYNKGLSESKFDIVVCCHNDIKLENGWGKKLLNDFNSNPEFGIIGKAGSCFFPESGVYWEKMQYTMVGQVYHHPDGQSKWLNKYSEKLPFLIPVVTIDGLFMSFDKNKIKHTFDETIGKFHFYDHSFCLPNYLDNVKIGVTSSFEITHKSVGNPNQEFFESKEKFLSKYKNSLPIEVRPTTLYIPNIKDDNFKKMGKIAIIIPTKGNVDMLFNCIDSFFKECDKNLFDIFIADTGSTDEEKEKIKIKINSFSNINLIEYDYYNFAKINNDVVKNHISDDYEFLLFSNNDIKVLNNVIGGMLKIFKTTANVGTVGCRLHFGDNTVQHAGILTFFSKQRAFQLTHDEIFSFYPKKIKIEKVFGNTAALLMIRKKTFEKCGMFNEKYISCFEDVELNVKCTIIGLNNYYDGNLVAYHYESQTRKNDTEYNNKLQFDYENFLFPFLVNNFNKIKTQLRYVE